MLIVLAVACPRSPAPADLEPPFLADRSKGGELPPVADRLPTNPRVINLAGNGPAARQAMAAGSIRLIGSQKDIRVDDDQRLFAARRL